MRYPRKTTTSNKLVKFLRIMTPFMMLLSLVVGNMSSVVQAAGPTVSVTSPTTNTVQKGTFNLTATAGAGTLGVTFKVSGPLVSKTFAEDTAAPYSVSWDSSAGALNKFDYTITAVARGSGGSTTSAPVKVKLDNPATPGTVEVVGDDVTQQAFDPEADNPGNDFTSTATYTANAPTAGNRFIFAHLGWKVPNVQDTVNNYSAFKVPQKLVVAMGLDDAAPTSHGGDGWTSADVDRFRTLINTVHSTSCVVLVLPGHGPNVEQYYSGWSAEIDKARADLTQLATQRPHTFTIDWQKVIDQHPEYLDEDSIHLPTPNKLPADDMAMAQQDKMNPTDPVAAAARQDFYWNGVAQCDTPTTTFPTTPDAQTTVNNATVQGNVPLSITATGAPSVQFQVDGQNIGSPITTAPYRANWDSNTMPNATPTTNGTHAITAVSTNPTGTSTASISVKVQNPPIPGTVELVGDSITFQAFWYHGFLPTAPDQSKLDVFAWLGWQVKDVQQHVTDQAAQRKPETLIVALGTNDSADLTAWGGDNGWTQADVDRFRTLINTVHPDTKVAIVLPGYGTGIDAYHAAQEDLAKRDLTALAATRPHTVVVSWQALIDADPSVMETDGIHLATETYNNPDGTPALNSDGTPARRVTEHAAAVRQQLYWDAWHLALQN